MGERNRKPKRKDAPPPLFDGFGSQTEYEDALRRLERFLAVLDRWDREKKVNLDLDEPSCN